MTQPPPRTRYRIQFRKEGVLRYTSHLDTARIWERTLRRAHAPVVYSQGFNPRPKMQIAAALPLGYSSAFEIIDVWLEDDVPQPDDLLNALRENAPQGLAVDRVWEVNERGPALQTLTTHASYTITLPDHLSPDDLRTRITDFLAQGEIWVEGKKRPKDVRPMLLKLEVTQEAPPTLHAELGLSQHGGTLRPDVVLELLGLDPLSAKIRRTALHFSEPL